LQYGETLFQSTSTLTRAIVAPGYILSIKANYASTEKKNGEMQFFHHEINVQIGIKKVSVKMGSEENTL